MTVAIQLRSASPPLDVYQGTVRLFHLVLSLLGAGVFNRRFTFALCVVTTLVSKAVHFYVYRTVIKDGQVGRWSYSFFGQDIVLLILCHLFITRRFDISRAGTLRAVVGMAGTLLVSTTIFVAIINTAVFWGSGTEVHWANASMAQDAAGIRTLLSGLGPTIWITVLCILAAAIVQVPVHAVFDAASNIVVAPFPFLSYVATVGPRALPRPSTWRLWGGDAARHMRGTGTSAPDVESPLEPKDYELSDSDSEEEKETLLGKAGRSTRARSLRTWLNPRNWPSQLWAVLGHAAVFGALLAMFIMCMMRPNKSTLNILSVTTLAAPFMGWGGSSYEALEEMKPLYGSGIGFKWDRKSAVRRGPTYPWLPTDRVAPGFEDRYGRNKYYQASRDPLKISNLDDKTLEALGDLRNVPVRHVVTIILESTRKDMFPLKNDGYYPKALADTWNSKTMPDEAIERLETLTPNARFLTGDFDDGWTHPGEVQKGRGGMNMNAAYTTATYTLKSLTGTLCGVSPLMVDFNKEFYHHLYQPCLPQVLDVLGRLDHGDDAFNKGFLSYPWKSTYMQSVTSTFDEERGLLDKMGYQTRIDKEYLQSSEAKFGAVTLPDVNYFGFIEEPLMDYIKDEFTHAKENNGRVLLTHLTSTSHHPYNIPHSTRPGEVYINLADDNDDLSRYPNAIGYDDRWLGMILGALDDLGVANETLVVLVGDHGLSIPENGKLPTYYNPNTINNLVPMVFSHPLLPQIQIDAPVSSRDILPTILDLLAETGSLSQSAIKASRDLVANYEGQSLIRPVKDHNRRTSNWHFSTVNPGGAQLGIRDTRHPDWALTIPVGDSAVMWEISFDDHSNRTIVDTEFHEFLRSVEAQTDIETAKWAEEAAFIGRWMVEDNARRWRYGRYVSL
jgi:arylsulfatase A-like enzyme